MKVRARPGTAFRVIAAAFATFAVVLWPAPCAVAQSAAGEVSVVSLSGPDTQALRSSSHGVVSGTGRFVVFETLASLVPEDVNEAADVYLRDRKTGAVERVSVATDGSGGDGASHSAGVSRNGRFVVFVSEATDLVPGDGNGVADVFLRDRKLGLTARVSVASNGGEADGPSGAPVVSADGRVVAFDSLATDLVAGDGNGRRDVFVHDRKTGFTDRVSVGHGGVEGDGDSQDATLTANGRRVVFASRATNLVPDDGNGAVDLFLRDRVSGQFERVSLDAQGGEADGDSFAPRLTDSGRWLVFTSAATDLVAGDDEGAVDVFLRDLAKGLTERVSTAAGGGPAEGASGDSSEGSISSNGRFVAFLSEAADLVPGDDNGVADVFVRDRKTGATVRSSTSPDGAPTTSPAVAPRLSGNGRVVVFSTAADNLVRGDTNEQSDVFARELPKGAQPAPGAERVSVFAAGQRGTGASENGRVTANGRFLTYESVADNLVPVDENGAVRDVFWHDRKLGRVQLLSVALDGTGADGASDGAVPADNGRLVVFRSDATDLVAGDTNGLGDVFLRDVKNGTTRALSRTPAGGAADGASSEPDLARKGKVAAFTSAATDLVGDDTNGVADVFVWVAKTGAVERVSLPDGAASGEPGAPAEANGASGQPSLSANGRLVAFTSSAFNLVPGDSNGASDVFVHDRNTGRTTRVSVASDGGQAGGSSLRPHLSASGRFVAFASNANDLVDGDFNGTTDVFVHDRKTGVTVRASHHSLGPQGNAASFMPRLSPSGRFVVFSSSASNLVADDDNGAMDVFRHELATGETLRLSVTAAGVEVAEGGTMPAVSARGRHVLFQSTSDALVTTDDDGLLDVLLKDLE